MKLLPHCLAASWLVFLAGCAATTPTNFKDFSDAGRRHQILGHWYDQYLQGANFASGDTVYRGDGTFAAKYESVSPGTGDAPTRRETVSWSGKWRIENGQLVEDITQVSDPARTPADRPLIRSIAEINSIHLILRSATGNENSYARKQPQPPKVSYKPYDG